MELQFNNKTDKTAVLQKVENYTFENFAEYNRSLLIYGDNFCGLSFLLQKQFANKIDLIYIDPPFNTNQTFYLSEKRGNTVSKPLNGNFAYCDRFIIDDYLQFMWERLILLRELLSEQGSIYVHIDTKMGHYLKILLDEIFGPDNFKNDITRIKSNPKNFERMAYGNEKDIILFYAKNHSKNIWNDIRIPLTKNEIASAYPKTDRNGRYTTIPLHAPGATVNGITNSEWRGLTPPDGRHWRTSPQNFDILDSNGQIEWSPTGNPRIKKYLKDHKGKKIQDIWQFKDPQHPKYPTQKNQQLIELIIRQSSNPESTVLDCFAGGGTTMYACEKTGRKWIGMDSSAQAINTIEKNSELLSEYDFLDLTSY